MEVGLFGTCNNSQWREALIPLLECMYFNPVVEDWNEGAQKIEIEKRETCDFILYTITPKMTGVYSIAEAVFDSCTQPRKVLFCVLNEDDHNEFTEHQGKSIDMTKKLISECGVRTFNDLVSVATFLNYVNQKIN